MSNIGSALTAFALGVWAYQRSGRIIDLALVIMLAQLPVVLVRRSAGRSPTGSTGGASCSPATPSPGLATLALVALLPPGDSRCGMRASS